MDASDVPTFASLQPWAQAAAAILFVAGSAVVALRGWLKGKPERAGMGEEDVVEALRHLRWIARHMERMADAAEEGVRLQERSVRALEDRPQEARRVRRARKTGE